MPLSFWLELILVLGERFEAQHAERLQFQGFRLLAMDGTRLTLPDEKALRDYYGTAVNGKGRQNAQARMVLLQSPLTRLPLAYQLQPVNVGEVTMARQLVAGLRPGAGLRANDLLLLDAGYLSYGLLWDIQSRGAFFCIRMQRNMNLRSLPRLPGGSGDSRRERWVRWTPKDSRGKWRAEGLPRSIDLRLISYHVPGHRRIQLLTNAFWSHGEGLVTLIEIERRAEERGEVGGRRRLEGERAQHRQGVDAFDHVVTGRLAEFALVAVTSKMSSTIWNTVP